MQQSLRDLPEVFNYGAKDVTLRAEGNRQYTTRIDNDDRQRCTMMRRGGWFDYLCAQGNSTANSISLWATLDGVVRMPYVDVDRQKLMLVRLMPEGSLMIAAMEQNLSHPNLLKPQHALVEMSNGVWTRVRLFEEVEYLQSLYVNESRQLSEDVAFALMLDAAEIITYLHSQGVAGTLPLYVMKSSGKDVMPELVYILDSNNTYVSGVTRVKIDNTAEVSYWNETQLFNRVLNTFSSEHIKEIQLTLYEGAKDYKKEFALPIITWEIDGYAKQLLSSLFVYITHNMNLLDMSPVYYDMLMVLISLNLHKGVEVREIKYAGEEIKLNTLVREYAKHLPQTRYVRMPWNSFTDIRIVNYWYNVREYEEKRKELLNSFDPTVTYLTRREVISVTYDGVELPNEHLDVHTLELDKAKDRNVLEKRIENVAVTRVSDVVIPTPTHEYVVINNVEFKAEDLLTVFFDTPFATVAETIDSYVFNDITESDMRVVKELLSGRIMFMTFYKELSPSAFNRLGGANTLLGMYELIGVRQIIDQNFVLGMPFRTQMKNRIDFRGVHEREIGVNYRYLNQRLDAM